MERCEGRPFHPSIPRGDCRRVIFSVLQAAMATKEGADWHPGDTDQIASAAELAVIRRDFVRRLEGLGEGRADRLYPGYLPTYWVHSEVAAAER